MILRTLGCAIILALFATSAVAQSKGTPTLQIDKSGTTRCLYIYDIQNQSNPQSLGCLNSTTKAWTPANLGTLNLSTLGAALDNSGPDQSTIQTIYGGLPNGSVIQIPQTSTWNATITASPSKSMTWIFGGTVAPTPTTVFGDNDLSIGYTNSTMLLTKKLASTTSFTYPSYNFLWNQDPNFNGPLAGNFAQWTPIYSKAISGPTSTGNTGTYYGLMQSYGQNPSAAYDVNGFFETQRYGQNSTWSLVAESEDFTGRPSQAFSNWMMEGNIRTNGYDITPWDANYYNPSVAGGRVGFYLSWSSMAQSAWAATTSVVAFSNAPNSLAGATVIKVNVGGTNYLWYCTTSGTTGGTIPSFSAPSRFTGSITTTTLTVTGVTTGTINAGDWVSGQGFITPVQVQAYGTGGTTGTGSTGTYALSPTIGSSTVTGGFWSAPHVTDGTATWSFGTTFQQGASHALYITGDVDLSTMIGGNTQIANAVLDTSAFTMDTGAAAIRVGSNQILDFSANGTAAGINQHALRYSSSFSALVYTVGASTEFSVSDTGNLVTQSITIPASNTINLSSGTTHTIQYSPATAGGSLAYSNGTTTLWYVDPSGNNIITGHYNSPLSTPASSSATCATGTQQADASFVYVCTATNTWKRAALSTF